MSYVSATDYWARRDPRLNRPFWAQDRHWWAEQAPSSKPPEIPRHRFSAKAVLPFEVRLTDAVRKAITEEIAWTRQAFRDNKVRETGGYLFSLERPGTRFAEICFASGPGADSKHGPNGMQLTHRDDVVRAELPDFLDHLRPAGCWHLHPSGGPEPSPEDLFAFGRGMERDGYFQRVALIVTRGDSAALGWSFPTFSAFRTRVDYDPDTGRRRGTVTEPAFIDA